MQTEKCYDGIVPNWERADGRAVTGLKSFRERRFFMPKSRKEVFCMVRQTGKGRKRLQSAYWSLVGMASAMLVSLQPVMADTIWERFSEIMKDVYIQLVGISTIVAVTVSAIALLVRMISRNQRAVDEATSWIKRIVITWIVLNSLGFVVAYLQPLIEGGNYSPV